MTDLQIERPVFDAAKEGDVYLIPVVVREVDRGNGDDELSVEMVGRQQHQWFNPPDVAKWVSPAELAALCDWLNPAFETPGSHEAWHHGSPCPYAEVIPAYLRGEPDPRRMAPRLGIPTKVRNQWLWVCGPIALELKTFTWFGCRITVSVGLGRQR